MLARNPLGLSIDFPDKEYELGDRIDVSLILTPSRDVSIRKARVDLVCDQTYTQHSAWLGGTVPRVGYSGRAVYVEAGSNVGQSTESYVHSTTSTMNDVVLRAGVAETRRADLRIDPTPPERWEQAVQAHHNAAAAWGFAWRLKVSVDVVRGRDQKAEREVRVKLPPMPAGGIGPKPRMSSPKRPTGQE